MVTFASASVLVVVVVVTPRVPVLVETTSIPESLVEVGVVVVAVFILTAVAVTGSTV